MIEQDSANNIKSIYNMYRDRDNLEMLKSFLVLDDFCCTKYLIVKVVKYYILINFAGSSATYHDNTY